MFINDSELDDIEKKKGKKKDIKKKKVKNNDDLPFYVEKIKIQEKKKKNSEAEENQDNEDNFYIQENDDEQEPSFDDTITNPHFNKATLIIISLLVIIPVGIFLLGIIKKNFFIDYEVKTSLTSMGIIKNNSRQLNYLVIPDNKVDVKIESSNTDMASINAITGYINALKVGEANIKLSVKNEEKNNITIYIVDSKIPLTDFTVNETITINRNKKDMLTITPIPSNATELDFSYQSSDETMVSVDDGIITGLKKGTTTISIQHGNTIKIMTVIVK